jgi:adenylate cyclase
LTKPARCRRSCAIDLLEPYLRLVGDHMKSWFKNDSDFDPIRSHPRYKDLLKLIS